MQFLQWCRARVDGTDASRRLVIPTALTMMTIDLRWTCLPLGTRICCSDFVTFLLLNRRIGSRNYYTVSSICRLQQLSTRINNRMAAETAPWPPIGTSDVSDSRNGRDERQQRTQQQPATVDFAPTSRRVMTQAESVYTMSDAEDDIAQFAMIGLHSSSNGDVRCAMTSDGGNETPVLHLASGRGSSARLGRIPTGITGIDETHAATTSFITTVTTTSNVNSSKSSAEELLPRGISSATHTFGLDSGAISVSGAPVAVDEVSRNGNGCGDAQLHIRRYSAHSGISALSGVSAADEAATKSTLQRYGPVQANSNSAASSMPPSPAFVPPQLTGSISIRALQTQQSREVPSAPGQHLPVSHAAPAVKKGSATARHRCCSRPSSNSTSLAATPGVLASIATARRLATAALVVFLATWSAAAAVVAADAGFLQPASASTCSSPLVSWCQAYSITSILSLFVLLVSFGAGPVAAEGRKIGMCACCQRRSSILDGNAMISRFSLGSSPFGTHNHHGIDIETAPSQPTMLQRVPAWILAPVAMMLVMIMELIVGSGLLGFASSSASTCTASRVYIDTLDTIIASWAFAVATTCAMVIAFHSTAFDGVDQPKIKGVAYADGSNSAPTAPNRPAALSTCDSDTGHANTTNNISVSNTFSSSAAAAHRGYRAYVSFEQFKRSGETVRCYDINENTGAPEQSAVASRMDAPALIMHSTGAPSATRRVIGIPFPFGFRSRASTSVNVVASSSHGKPPFGSPLKMKKRSSRRDNTATDPKMVVQHRHQAELPIDPTAAGRPRADSKRTHASKWASQRAIGGDTSHDVDTSISASKAAIMFAKGTDPDMQRTTSSNVFLHHSAASGSSDDGTADQVTGICNPRHRQVSSVPDVDLRDAMEDTERLQTKDSDDDKRSLIMSASVSTRTSASGAAPIRGLTKQGAGARRPPLRVVVLGGDDDQKQQPHHDHVQSSTGLDDVETPNGSTCYGHQHDGDDDCIEDAEDEDDVRSGYGPDREVDTLPHSNKHNHRTSSIASAMGTVIASAAGAGRDTLRHVVRVSVTTVGAAVSAVADIATGITGRRSSRIRTKSRSRAGSAAVGGGDYMGVEIMNRTSSVASTASSAVTEATCAYDGAIPTQSTDDASTCDRRLTDTEARSNSQSISGSIAGSGIGSQEYAGPEMVVGDVSSAASATTSATSAIPPLFNGLGDAQSPKSAVTASLSLSATTVTSPSTPKSIAPSAPDVADDEVHSAAFAANSGLSGPVRFASGSVDRYRSTTPELEMLEAGVGHGSTSCSNSDEATRSNSDSRLRGLVSGAVTPELDAAMLSEMAADLQLDDARDASRSAAAGGRGGGRSSTATVVFSDDGANGDE